MKLVISTQYRENYGTAEQPYWKNKMGSVYVVEGLTEKQVNKVRMQGVPTLKGLIEYANSGSEEYIIGFDTYPDGKKVCDDWEAPVVMSYSKGLGKWVAMINQKNDGCFRMEIAEKHETYVMEPEGGRSDYKCSFTLQSGEVVTYEEMTKRVQA